MDRQEKIKIAKAYAIREAIKLSVFLAVLALALWLIYLENEPLYKALDGGQ